MAGICASTAALSASLPPAALSATGAAASATRDAALCTNSRLLESRPPRRAISTSLPRWFARRRRILAPAQRRPVRTEPHRRDQVGIIPTLGSRFDREAERVFKLAAYDI